MNRELITAKSNLMQNAFDFLRRAIEDFDDDLKSSVINFATAIELLLKARLINEHWTLVVDRSSDVDIDAFLEGKSRTVTLHEAIRRLEKVWLFHRMHKQESRRMEMAGEDQENVYPHCPLENAKTANDNHVQTFGKRQRLLSSCR